MSVSCLSFLTLARVIVYISAVVNKSQFDNITINNNRSFLRFYIVHCDFFSVTIISTFIMGILFLSEVNYYLTPTLSEELFVDTSRGSKLRINLDIIIPAISCDREYAKVSIWIEEER